MVKCYKCGVELTDENWRPSRRGKENICKYCERKREAARRARNREKIREYHRQWRAKHRDKVKTYSRIATLRMIYEVMSHYCGGEPKCMRCGFADFRALTFHHVNGGGCEHRRQPGLKSQYSFAKWLKENNYPPDIEVLCMNCQFIDRYESGEWTLRTLLPAIKRGLREKPKQ